MCKYSSCGLCRRGACVMVNINEKEKRGSGGGYTLSNSLQLSPMRHLGSVVRTRRHALSSPQSVSH